LKNILLRGKMTVAVRGSERGFIGAMPMAGQLIAPADLAPPVPHNLTPAEAIAFWVGLMNLNEQLLLAGLRREIGPGGDLQAAHRQWYEAHMQEHDRTMRRMMENLNRAGGVRDR
jgi:hypothetical protein